MNSAIRPILMFAIATIVIVAGFWAVFTYAAGYDRNLGQKAAEATQRQPGSIAAVDARESQAPAATPQPKAASPAPSSSPQAGSQTPSPAMPQAQTAKPSVQSQAATVPATGSSMTQSFLLATTLSVGVYLAMRLYAQSFTLRPNR